MAISDLSQLKNLLQLNKYQDEWIQESKMIVSPLGDFMVVSSGYCAVFLVKKYTPTPEFQICRAHRPSSTFEISPDNTIDCGLISAVHYLPIKIEEHGRSHDVLHCVILGYSSGVIEFVSGSSGQILAQKLPVEKPVKMFRSVSVASNELKKVHCLSSLACLQNLLELLVVYETCLVAISGCNLLTTLMKNLRELGSNFNEKTQKTCQLSKFPCKKMSLDDQALTDVSGIVVSSFQIFDQLSFITMNKELFHEDQVRNTTNMTKYISVGSSTFLVTSTSHRFGPPRVKELAENVVSTVKSKIFGIASGLIWGSVSPSGKSESSYDQDVPVDQDIKLQVLHAFKDNSKTAVSIETCQNGRYSAILDSHHRVLVQDNSSGSVIHILKGYHHAQIGWITTSWEGKKEAPERLPSSSQEFSMLLVLYLPRRGILEVWSPEQMCRIVEFPVGKTGRLIRPSEAIIDSSKRSNAPARSFECSYLSPDGMIQQLYIPVHALSNKSTSHDRTLQKQLRQIIADEAPMENKITKITDLILASKDVSTKLLMVIDLFQSEICPSASCREIIEKMREQLIECPAAKRHCDRLERALDFYDFVTSQSTQTSNELELERNYSREDFLKDFIELKEIFVTNEPMKLEDFSLSEFSSCFQLGRFIDKKELSEKVGSETCIDSLCFVELRTSNSKSMVKLFSYLGVDALRHFEKTKEALTSAKIEGPLLEASLNHLIGASLNELYNIHPTEMAFLFRLLFELHAEENFNSGMLNTIRKLILKSRLAPSSVIVIISWQNYLANFHSSTLASEWKLVLKNMASYLVMKNWFNDINIPLCNDQNQNLSHYYDDVFLNGNGRISELIADWVFESRESIHSDLIEKFLGSCRSIFPLSSRREVITVHLTWKYLQVWSKNHSDLNLLTKAFDSLMGLKSTKIRKSLAALVWSTFFCKAAKDVVSITEIRSATRCERELGLSESQLATFLNLCVQILMIPLRSKGSFELSDDEEHTFASESYDVIPGSSARVDHVMDIVQKQLSFDADFTSIQYQFLFVANAIWSFGISDVKPLSLFNSQESNAFFQNTSSLSASLRLFGREHGRSVRNGRRKFLEQVLDKAVTEIHHTTGSNDGVDFGLYQVWCHKLRILSEMWNMIEKFTEYQIVSLYRGGHDAIGDEIFNTLSEEERKSVGVQLLRVSLMRLAAFLRYEDGRYQRIASTHPELTSKIRALNREACGPNGVAEVPMKYTSDLLVSITKLDIDQDNLQLAYECLTVVQLVRKD